MIPGQEHMVCRLRKSLYGLKQSPRCWNTRLDGHLKQLGFKALKTDSVLYTKGVKQDKILLAVYVDDLLISSKSRKSVLIVKAALSAEFKMTDQGEVDTILGIKIQWNREEGTLMMSQQVYADTILKGFNMENYKGRATVMDQGVQLSRTLTPAIREEQEAMDRTPYSLLPDVPDDQYQT